MPDESNQEPFFAYLKDRRNIVPDQDNRKVVYSHKQMTPERLEALRRYLATATPEEIASVRAAFGGMPEVLNALNL